MTATDFFPSAEPGTLTRTGFAKLREEAYIAFQADCERRGVVAEFPRVELIEGTIVPMTPAKPPHDNSIEYLNELFVKNLPSVYSVRPQLSFVVSDSTELIPDLAVVARHRDRSDHPSTAQLVIEISDTSLRKDRVEKAPLYAAIPVPEYWVVDVKGRQLIQHSAPNNGTYTKVVKLPWDRSPATAQFLTVAVDLTALGSNHMPNESDANDAQDIEFIRQKLAASEKSVEEHGWVKKSPEELLEGFKENARRDGLI